jgi:selenocysteine-specific elongation factor
MTAAKGINITLGTAGHIDHGKTSLVKCLTGCDTDRLKIEKERGMSIELGFAPCLISGMEVGIVDVPGHEDFIKTMVAGATGIDAVILVIAADDGVMLQTREHLDILTLLGVEFGIVALTKSDCVAEERIERVSREIREFLEGTFLADAPIVPVSNITGAGFDVLLDTLKELVGKIKPRRTDGIFRLPVERTFSLKGYGTVVTGIPVSGNARTGDEIVILPQGLTGRIRAIQVFKHQSDIALCGQCSAINIPQWDHRTIKRGDVATVEGFFRPQQWFLCSLKVLASHKTPVKNGLAVKFHTGTSEVAGKIFLLQANPLGPADQAPVGDEALVQIWLNEPVVAGPRDPFIVRDLSPARTMGGGTIVEPIPAKLRRSKAEVIEQCRRLAKAVKNNKDFVEYCVETPKGIVANESELAFRVKLRIEQLKPILEELVERGKVKALSTKVYIHTRTLESVRDSIVSILRKYHSGNPDKTGLGLAPLAEASGLKQDILAAILDLLVKEGVVGRVKEQLALPGFKPIFSEKQKSMMEAVESAYKKRLFNPPLIEEAAILAGISQKDLHNTLRMLVGQNSLVEIEKGLFFHHDAIEQAKARISGFIKEQGKLESVKFKYILDTTRKYAIPLLDYFDRTGLTYRQGYTRYLRKGL